MKLKVITKGVRMTPILNDKIEKLASAKQMNASELIRFLFLELISNGSVLLSDEEFRAINDTK